MKKSIIIIGAGMGGLTAAAALHQRGFDVRVYEQAAQFVRLGAGIQMSPNAMRVLRGIGLEARIRERAFQPHSWTNREWDTGAMKYELPLGADADLEAPVGDDVDGRDHVGEHGRVPVDRAGDEASQADALRGGGHGGDATDTQLVVRKFLHRHHHGLQLRRNQGVKKTLDHQDETEGRQQASRHHCAGWAGAGVAGDWSPK